MSDKESTIIEGPDGRLYEIPHDRLDEFAVPGEKVEEIRQRQAASAGGAAGDALPPGHYRPGELPPGHSAPPPAHSAGPPAGAGAMPSMSIQPNGDGGMVLNFFFTGGPPTVSASAAYPPPDAGVEGYHMSFDESGIPVNHTEMLWGDYIDKQGNPAVGFHSHDPATGNAQ